MTANARASSLEEAWEREHHPSKRNSMYLCCVCVHMCTCIYIHVCGAQRSMSGLFLDHLSSYLSSHLLRLELTDLSRLVGLSAPTPPGSASLVLGLQAVRFSANVCPATLSH